ncbi:MAG: baseplate J/gp47 family protein [Candidatus Levybacteria bacterium]|nr:baseplate J/gp47 family protein [Candidatus Levybacteria bacterium]
MKLSIPSFINKEKKPEYFLALLLRDEKVSAVIIEEFQGKIKVVGKHDEYFDTNLEEAPIDEWLDILDKTISKAEETLPADVETHKTVFGVKEEWVDEKKIKKEYLARLKKVCEALKLTPIGFLVTTEAITHLMKEEEGAPVSALLIQVSKKSVSVSLIRAGRFVESKIHPLEDSVVAAIDKLLKSFEDVEVFPSRIVLFDSKHEELAQELISHQWSKSLPFLHVPQISMLPIDFDARAIVFGAASQMGLSMSDSVIDREGTEIKTFTGKESKGEKETEGGKDAEGGAHEKESIKDGALEFGFVMNQDVEKAKPSEEMTTEQPHHKIVSHRERVDEHATHAFSNNPHANIREPELPENNEESPSRSSMVNQSERNGLSLSGVTSLFAGIISKIPLRSIFSLPSTIGRGGKAVFIAPLVVLVLLGIVLLYFFQLRSTITLSVNPKDIQEQETLVFSLSSGNDFSHNVISAKDVTVDLPGKATTQATGKKDVGNKAKGSVTIYNNNDSKKTLNQGTTITANTLEFTLDKDVSVSSASGDIFSGTKPGTATVAVTAAKIGTEYNLPSGAKFSVADSSSVAAKNDQAFSGGSKKQVTVVAKKDRDKLLADLPKSLQEKAKDTIGKKIESNDTILPVFSEATLSKKDFDKDENDEAKNVTLTATVAFIYYVYKNDDLTQFTKELVKNRYGDENNITQDGITKELTDIKEKGDDEVEAKITIKGGLMPKLDTKKLKDELAGKSFTDAYDLLSKQSQVNGVDIALFPPIPFLPKLLPRVSDNITIVIKTNE